MRKYVPLATSLRPNKWEEFVANEPIILILKSMLSKKSIPNGILLSGTRGVGKTSAARLFAKALNCDKLDKNQNPCGKCDSCKSFDGGSHPDIIEMSGSTNGKIEDVRNIIESSTYSPMLSNYKVFIIDEAQGLGVSQSSWDALLKVLEEPSPYVVWVFCSTRKEKIPVTIKSRLISLDFHLVPTKTISGYLENLIPNKSPEIAGIIARSSNNSIRDSLTLLEKVMPYCNERGWEAKNVLDVIGSLDLLQIESILNFIESNNAPALWGTLDQMIESGVHPDTVFHEGLMEPISSLMSVGLGAQIDNGDMYSSHFEKLKLARVMYLANIMMKRSPDYDNSANKKFILQLISLELCA